MIGQMLPSKGQLLLKILHLIQFLKKEKKESHFCCLSIYKNTKTSLMLIILQIAEPMQFMEIVLKCQCQILTTF